MLLTRLHTRDLNARVCTGDVNDDAFSLLCTLNKFQFNGNPGLVQDTLAGYLACTLTTLKCEESISVHSCTLRGTDKMSNSAANADPSRLAVSHARRNAAKDDAALAPNPRFERVI